LGSAVQSFPQLPQFLGSVIEPQTASAPASAFMAVSPPASGSITFVISRPCRQPAAASHTTATQPTCETHARDTLRAVMSSSPQRGQERIPRKR
jgi:hypothetical protein